MSDIFREVEEDVRRERYAKLWKQYGDYVIGFAALVVIAVAGYQLWLRYEAKQQLRASEEFTAAMELTDPAQSEAAFAHLAQNAPGGYAKLARFQQANALLQSGKRDAAVTIYKQIAPSDDTLLGGAARLRAAWALADTASKSDLEALISPLTDASSPWRFMAREILAFADYKAGNEKQALAGFQMLAREPDAPQGIRERASAMAAYLKSGGDKDVGTVPKPAPPPVPSIDVTHAPPGAAAPGSAPAAGTPAPASAPAPQTITVNPTTTAAKPPAAPATPPAGAPHK